MVCLAGAHTVLNAQELDFTTGLEEFRELRTMLHAHVRRLALEHLEKRRTTVARWTASDVQARKTYVRERMQESLGGSFPERTPLNPRLTGVIDRGDYRIEKIVFESQPSFYVTANLYVPARGQPPFPAVLYPLGHETGAKSHHAWQQMLGTLAKRGYVALAWDPVGQGERVQLWDAEAAGPKIARSSTYEHTMLGIQCLLTGDNLARYTVWDGIRALDYLLSRKEVDPNRIAVTGNSGGGTHTAYLAAMEDRIHVAAPSCYLTNWRLLLDTRGPQDAEQVLLPWLAAGLDHADFVHAFAGKPYLILSAIRDFFAIAGARETFAEAKRAYSLIGATDKMAMAEADDVHGYSQPRRLAAYNWFDRWLKGKAGEPTEPEIHMATEDELFCTDSGQVTVSLGGDTVFTLNRKRAEQFRKQPGADLIGEVRRLTAYERPQGPVQVRSYGVIRRAGYSIEKLVYDSEPGIVVPALFVVPEGGPPKKPAILWVHSRGKSTDAEPEGDIAGLVRAGAAVLAIDARGYGATQTSVNKTEEWSRWFGDYNSAMTALLLGKTLVGMRAEDITRAIDLLTTRPEVDPEHIAAVGIEGAAVPLLHAAVLDPRIRKLALERMLLSYAAVLDRPIHRQIFENVVRGVLRSYDLPTLAAAISPRPVVIVDAVDSAGNLVKLERVRSEYGGVGSGQIRRRGMNQPASSLYAGLVQ